MPQISLNAFYSKGGLHTYPFNKVVPPLYPKQRTPEIQEGGKDVVEKAPFSKTLAWKLISFPPVACFPRRIPHSSIQNSHIHYSPLLLSTLVHHLRLWCKEYKEGYSENKEKEISHNYTAPASSAAKFANLSRNQSTMALVIWRQIYA